jgi:hypothetical protein
MLLMTEKDDQPYAPVHDEAYYEGDYYDHSPQGKTGATISYSHHDNPEGYTVDPREVQFTTEGLASGVDDELSWGDEERRIATAKTVLKHHLGRSPMQDELELFMQAIGQGWADGDPWVIYEGEITQALNS